MPQVQDTFSDFAGYVLAVDGAESHVRRSGAEYDAAIGVTEASAWNVDSLNDDEVASNGSSLSEIAALEAPRLRAETRLPPPPPPRRGSGRGGGRGGGAMLRGFGAPQPLDDEFPIQLLDVPPGRNGSNAIAVAPLSPILFFERSISEIDLLLSSAVHSANVSRQVKFVDCNTTVVNALAVFKNFESAKAPWYPILFSDRFSKRSRSLVPRLFSMETTLFGVTRLFCMFSSSK